jgi:hypothetical protein
LIKAVEVFLALLRQCNCGLGGRHGRNKDGRLGADLTSSKTKSRLRGIGRLCHASGAARSSGSGFAVMQPINLGSGEDPILDLNRCGDLSRLGQIVQRDHCIAQRWAINQMSPSMSVAGWLASA